MNKKINLGEQINTIENWVEKHYKIVFGIILAIAIFLNVYKLGYIPNVMNWDEAAAGYEGYCIANYGVDRYLNKFPVYFTNYGDGQSAFCIYCIAILVKIFGLNSVVVKIPNMILSIIEVVVAYLLVKEFKGKKQGLLFMLLVTIMPWHIMKSRWAIDSIALSPMLLISVYSLVKAIKSGKIRSYILSGIIFGITFYTYILSFIIIPAFLLMMLILLIKNKKIKLKQAIAFTIPLVLFATPLILMLMVQKGWIEPISSFFSIVKLKIYRENEVNLALMPIHLQNLASTFICDNDTHSSIKGIGNFYTWGIIPIVVGFVSTIFKTEKNKKDKLNLDTIMFCYFMANMLVGILVKTTTLRLNGILIPSTYFTLKFIELIYRKNKNVFAIIGLVYLTSFIAFTITYFVQYSNIELVCHDNGTKEAIEYVEEKYPEGKVYTITQCQQIYIFELYVNKESPYEYNATRRKSNTTEGYGRYYNNERIDLIENPDIFIIDEMSDFNIEYVNNINFEKEKVGKYYILHKKEE